MTYPYPVITIDGPSGTGKGTICQMLAKALNWNLLDSGVLYRVLAHAARQHKVDIYNEEALTILAEHLDVQFETMELELQPRVILEGTEVTDILRTEEYGRYASIVAAFPKVRTALLKRQRDFCQAPGLVTDGRDMGSVVFPKAVLKFFLDASKEERANRRFRQLKGKGINVNLGDVLREIEERDSRDRNRIIAPLKPADDAILLDTTHLSVEEVFALIMREVGNMGFVKQN